MRWRAYYTEGRVFRSEGYDWTELPSTGLLVLIVYAPTGRTIHDGADWYWYYQGQFGYVPSGDWGTWRAKPDVPCQSCIKQGVGVSDTEYHAVLRRALHEVE